LEVYALYKQKYHLEKLDPPEGDKRKSQVYIPGGKFDQRMSVAEAIFAIFHWLDLRDHLP
jgi:hypothetical protein